MSTLRPVLIDTSSWIEALRPDGNPLVRQKVKELMLEDRAAWCGMIRLELWNGARGEHEKKTLARMERDLHHLEATEEVWTLAMDMARRCRVNGVTAPATDLLIAAHALHHRTTLESCDAHHEEILRVCSA